MEADLSELERRAKEAAAKLTAAKAEHWARGVMRNVAYDAGAGPEMGANGMAEEMRRPTTIGGCSVDYSSGVARMVPTPEEARRAHEAARQTASAPLRGGTHGHGAFMPYSPFGEVTGGFNCAPHATVVPLGSIAQMPRAPGKMFGRETIVAIIWAAKTVPQHEEALSALNRLQSIFENLE